jgi:hypothetical protein
MALVLMAMGRGASAQLVIWAETFENGCAQGCYASAHAGINGAWTVTDVGAQGACPNRWFVSCRENGNPAGACGSDCTTNNASLHIANELSTVCGSPAGCIFCPTGDCGAAYDAGCPPGLCAFCFCGCLSTQTNKRAESPVIDLSGHSNVTLGFKYMENGQGTTDNFLLEYWDGTAWSALSDPAKTPTAGCGDQGRWTNYSIALPASANNNPAVRIGFRWQNNNDASGADPSVAIDDVQLSVPYAPDCVGPLVNEASNGPAGEEEYVELLVCGPPCTTVDLRNWIIDDNNGTVFNGFGTQMVGSGVSAGHLRFAAIAQWAAVPTGSLIVIYNNAAPNPDLPPDDPADTAPTDSVYVLPVGHAALQGCATLPNAVTSGAYAPCTYGAGIWSRIGMRNAGDAMQARRPDGSYFHGVSYGPDAQNMNGGGIDGLRISTLGHAGRLLHFNDGDPRDAANFTSAPVAGNQTPGAANNAANDLFRRMLLCGIVLPVELLAFTARNDGPAVLLEWATATETGNDHFTVERSSDAATFEAVLHAPGAGHSQVVVHYMAHDRSPLTGTSFYRLRQTDQDGTSTLGPVVAVTRPTAGHLLHAGLTEEGDIRLEHPAGATFWRIIDTLGRTIAQGTTGDGPVSLVPGQVLGTGLHVITLVHDMDAASFKLLRAGR